MYDQVTNERKTYCLRWPMALRGWQDRPLCLVNLEQPSVPPKTLTFSEFSMLSRCDGKHLLPDSEMLKHYLLENIITAGTQMVNDAQTYRYFPYVHRTSVKLSVTGRCNYHCMHCYVADEEGNMGGEISLDFFRSLASQMNDMGLSSMELTGGEPLLHPHLVQMLQCLADNRIELKTILTNGSLLTAEFLDQLTEMGHHPVVQVSFDGFGVHDWMRGVPGAEETTLRALRLLKEKGFHIRVGMNVNGKTASALLDSCRLLVREFRPDFYMYYTSPSPRWLETAKEDAVLDLGSYYDLCIALSRACVVEQWGVRVQMFQFPDVPDPRRFEAYRKALHQADSIPDSVPLVSCQFARNAIHIANDGRVLPCSGFEGVTHAVGFLCGEDVSLYCHTLADILTESSYLQMFRSVIGDLKKKEPDCAQCGWLNVCKGGCRLLSLDHYRKHLEYDRKSEAQCLFFRGGYARKYEQAMEDAFRAGSHT